MNSDLDVENGGQGCKVVEPLMSRDESVVVLEVEAYPEPKVLSAAELRGIKAVLGTNGRVGAHIGASLGFVRDRLSGAGD